MYTLTYSTNNGLYQEISVASRLYKVIDPIKHKEGYAVHWVDQQLSPVVVLASIIDLSYNYRLESPIYINGLTLDLLAEWLKGELEEGNKSIIEKTRCGIRNCTQDLESEEVLLSLWERVVAKAQGE